MEQVIPPPTAAARRYTPAEYLRISDATDQRLDYWDGVILDRNGNPVQFGPRGEVLDMAGASPNHGLISSNVGGEVRSRLKGTPCDVRDGSVQVRLGPGGRGAHPDVVVCCGEVQLDPESRTGPVILNPRLVFEVFSPSTEVYDRLRKAEGYRAIESLQEYVFVSQDEPRVETYYRSTDGVWSFGPTVTDPAASVHLRSVGVDLPLAEVYARVAFPPPAIMGQPGSPA